MISEFLSEHLVESSEYENPLLSTIVGGRIWFIGNEDSLDDVSSSIVGEDSHLFFLVGESSIAE